MKSVAPGERTGKLAEGLRNGGEAEELTSDPVRQAAKLVACCNAAVASSLFLTKRAVEKNINSIFSKLGLDDDTVVSRRVQAALLFLAESGAND